MDLQTIQPPAVNWNASNLAEAWKKFEQYVRLILDGPLKEKDDPIKINYLLLWVGETGRDIYNTWELSEDDKKSLDEHFTRFRNHVQPKKNSIFARYKFNEVRQGSESVEQFVTRIKLIAKDCAFQEPNEMIRDRIVFGTNSQKVKEILLNEGDTLTLEKAIQIAQTHEYNQEQLKRMNTTSHSNSTCPATADIHAVRPRQSNRRSNSNTQSAPPTSNKPPPRQQTKQHQRSKKLCGNCGNDHTPRQTCPAKGKKCRKCDKWNHYEKVCRSKSVNEIETTECRPEDDFFIDSIQQGSQIHDDQVFYDMSIGYENKIVKFKLDTGSQVNVLPYHIYCKLNISTPLLKSKRTLSAYNGNILPSLGICHLPCTHKSSKLDVEFYVVDTKSTPILGMKSCLDFGLIKLIYATETTLTPTKTRTDGEPSKVTPKPTCMTSQVPMTNESVLNENPDLFQGIGLLPGKADIQIDPSVTPVVHPPRKVPVSLRDKFKAELDRMCQTDVIAKVDEPTPWVNSLVIVEKPGTDKIRICLDPKDLNNAIIRPHYPMRTLEDILSKLTKASYFTKLDARSGYWAIQLSETSSFLTTFNTPFGRYRFLRLPFGLNCSQDLFQSKNGRIIREYGRSRCNSGRYTCVWVVTN